LNSAYTFGFVFFVGQSNFNVSLRPWEKINNVGTFLQTYVQIQNGSTATNNPILSGVENDEVTVKVIFDSEAGKIYAFVNGMNVSDCITTSYGGTETLSAKFSYLCEAGSLAGYYKDWKILSGRAAVEKAISESYSTESYNGSTKTNSFVGTVNIANDGVGKTTQTMIFDAIITAESDTYEAGLQLICEGANAGASIIYVTVSADKVYAYNHTVAGNVNHGSRFWTITASRTHRLQLKVSAHGALYIWVDGVQKGGYFMTDFGNTSATKFGKYSCWVINRGTGNVNVTYNFGGHKITASDITGTLTTDGTSSYYMSEKIAEMNLPAAGSSATTVSDVFTFGVIPTASGFAGVRVEDEFGNYFTLRITANGWQIYKQGASSAFKAGNWTNKDGVYNLWLSMQARRVFNILEDRKTVLTAQFIDSVGSATNLGLS
ncbi:MAG: hypothetical protein MJ072_04980, partial [Clostridia bacterium]|nr:hypothetical protein [Clostridia bacterium]